MSRSRWGDSRGPDGRKSDDVLREPMAEADGEEVVHRRRSEVETVRGWVEEHQVLTLGLLALSLAGLLGAWHLGAISAFLDSIPPAVWSWLWYVGWGAAFATPPAYLVLRWMHSPSGHEILDLDPVTSEHRHVRIGRDLWDEFEITSPWSEEVSKADLQQCSVNGRSGYEVMDLRIPENGPPTAVVPWLGDASAAQLRAYRYAFVSAHRRLSKQANKAMAQEASRSEIIRESAQRVVTEMIRDAERSGMPHGDEIEQAVDDVLGDLGVSDSLRDDDLDDIDEWEPRSREERRREQQSSPPENQQNGHSDETRLPRVIES